jgi:hypothetical protein
MDWQAILGTVTSGVAGGGLLGWIGAIGTRLIEMKARREDHKMKLDEMAAARGIESDKAKAILEQIKEQGAADAFTSSIQAEGALPSGYAWVSATMKLWRPGLTLTMIAVAHVGALVIGFSTDDWEPAKAVILADSASAGWMIGYWFGRRDFRT